jgi:Flp pilus assembly protein TadB
MKYSMRRNTLRKREYPQRKKIAYSQCYSQWHGDDGEVRRDIERGLDAGPTMNAPVESTTRPASTSRVARRIAVAAIMGVLVFLVLWLMAVSFVTSVLIASCFCAVTVVASSVSDLVEAVLNAIAAVVFGILAAIAAVIAAIFS